MPWNFANTNTMLSKVEKYPILQWAGSKQQLIERCYARFSKLIPSQARSSEMNVDEGIRHPIWENSTKREMLNLARKKENKRREQETMRTRPWPYYLLHLIMFLFHPEKEYTANILLSNQGELFYLIDSNDSKYRLQLADFPQSMRKWNFICKTSVLRGEGTKIKHSILCMEGWRRLMDFL